MDNCLMWYLKEAGGEKDVVSINEWLLYYVPQDILSLS